MNRENVSEKIIAAKEVLSVYPKNNDKNVREYIEKLMSEKNIYSQLKDIIMLELKNRYLEFSKIKANEEVVELEKQISEIKKMLDKTNSLNTSYEKTKLDVILYNISKYYKGNLKTVNENIKEAIRIFNSFDIVVSEFDFAYSEFSKDYMRVFIKNIDNLDSKELSESFEKNYWKEPNIIKHIHISFRNLYYEKKEMFDKTIDLEIEKNHINFENLIKEYKQKNQKKEMILSIDPYNYLDLFQKDILKINDFDANKIKSLYLKYVGNYDDINTNDLILKLNDTVKEYKFYLEHKFIVDDVKRIINDSSKDLISSKNKLKDINAKEENFFKANKKSIFNIRFKKKNIDLDEEALKISSMYNELDDIIFREKVLENITLESKIYDVLYIASSYYSYINRLLKNKYNNITDGEILNFYYNLSDYLLSLDHTIINNLDAFDELDMPMIISNKYKLDGLNVSANDLAESNIENIIKETDNLINHHNLKISKDISLEKIDEYLKIKKVLNLWNYTENGQNNWFIIITIAYFQ